jgi:hypothetical protein
MNTGLHHLYWSANEITLNYRLTVVPSFSALSCILNGKDYPLLVLEDVSRRLVLHGQENLLLGSVV